MDNGLNNGGAGDSGQREQAGISVINRLNFYQSAQRLNGIIVFEGMLAKLDSAIASWWSIGGFWCCEHR